MRSQAILTTVLDGPSVTDRPMRDRVPGGPEDVRDIVRRAAGRRTYEVDIADDGSGRLAPYAR